MLSLALFPQVAPKFLAWRDGPKEEPAAPAAAAPAPAPAPAPVPAAPAASGGVRELYVEDLGI